MKSSVSAAGVAAIVAVATLSVGPAGAHDRAATATAASSAPDTSRVLAGDVGTTAERSARRDVARVRLRRAVKRLPTAGETRSGYDRDKFRHWTDRNGDCQDTRDEVLDAESRVEVSGCDIETGEWLSYYDGEVWTASSDVDIDHMVALAEAWDSGAKRWTSGTRERFANDLGDRRSLVAVTDNVNQSKSDQDPAEWLPERNTCRYIREWVAVKIRWSLKVDRSEKRSLRRQASGCRNTVLKVSEAKTRNRKKDNNDGGGGGRNCARGYDPCVPPPPPDLDCSDVNGPIRVTGSDPHNLDGDGDGVACE